MFIVRFLVRSDKPLHLNKDRSVRPSNPFLFIYSHGTRVAGSRVLQLSLLPVMHREAVVFVLAHARQQRSILAESLIGN